MSPPRHAHFDAPLQSKEPDPSAVLSIRDLNASYADNHVLFDVGLDLHKGSCLAIVGESGSGKTTMSRCLIGLHEDQTGTFLLRGEALPAHAHDRAKEARRDIQYVFQNPFGSLNPRRTVGASLEVPLRYFYGTRGKAARERIEEALGRVEIPARMIDMYPGQLSGGQQQRVAIARALVCNPSVLICDEVTSALDVSVQAHVVELLRGLLDDGLSMIFVTHNLAVVRSIADSMIVLSRGRVVESGASDRIFAAPEDEYTRKLLADTLEVTEAAAV